LIPRSLRLREDSALPSRASALPSLDSLQSPYASSCLIKPMPHQSSCPHSPNQVYASSRFLAVFISNHSRVLSLILLRPTRGRPRTQHPPAPTPVRARLPGSRKPALRWQPEHPMGRIQRQPLSFKPKMLGLVLEAQASNRPPSREASPRAGRPHRKGPSPPPRAGPTAGPAWARLRRRIGFESESARFHLA
jgi:hypothetical protein